MPVVNPVIVPVFPNDGQGIRSDCYHIADPRGGSIAELDSKHFRIGFRVHVLMSAAAGGTGAGGAQQLEGIDARVIVIPGNRKFSGFLIGSDTGWFFVHRSLSLRNGVNDWSR